MNDQQRTHQVPPLFGFLTLDRLPQVLDWFAQMRTEQPVFYDERSRMWHVFRYADVTEAITDHTRFSSEQRPGKMLPFAGTFLADTVVATDPPDHRRLRNLVNLAFTPRALARYEGRVAQITQELLDRVRGQGRMDIVDDFAFPLPAKIIAELLGVPDEDWAIFRRWARGDSEDFVDKTQPVTPAARQEGMRRMQLNMYDYFAELLAERRRNPREDVLSSLSQAEIDGERLTEADLVKFSILLLAAGQETTKNLIANAIICLTDHPDQLEQLRRNPELTGSAVEEVLRFMPPAINLFRLTTTEVELGGQRIPAEEMVLAWLFSANRDEAQFPNAERFDITRTPNRNIAFGHGIHFCLGAPLARLEAKVALPMLLEQLPNLQRVPNVPIRANMTLVFMVQNLPVTFDPS